MFDWLTIPFEEFSILWLLISAIIGGIIGASSKFVFETFLPEQLKLKQKSRELVAK